MRRRGSARLGRRVMTRVGSHVIAYNAMTVLCRWGKIRVFSVVVCLILAETHFHFTNTNGLQLIMGCIELKQSVCNEIFLWFLKMPIWLAEFHCYS